MAGGERLRRRVNRRDAAKILGTSYENVKKLQRRGFLTGVPDERGHYWLDRRAVEDLARARGEQKKQDLEFDARVFALFKEGKACRDVVIETRRPFEMIQRMWEQYCAGFDHDGASARERDAQSVREHDDQLRAMDEELDRRRRLAIGEDEPPPSRDEQKKGRK